MGCQAMAPVVHGLERRYAGRVDFLYLNVAEARNDSAKRALGFVSTPHFFFLRGDGSTVHANAGSRASRQSEAGAGHARGWDACTNRAIGVLRSPWPVHDHANPNHAQRATD